MSLPPLHAGIILISICLVHSIENNPNREFSTESFVNVPKNIQLVKNLHQILQLNQIGIAVILFDAINIDVVQDFLTTYKNTLQRQLVQIPTTKFDDETIIPKRVTIQPMANCETTWIFALQRDLRIGQELARYCQNTESRSKHNLSLVLAINRSFSEREIEVFLNATWNLLIPLDLIVLLCIDDDCTAYRFDKDTGLTQSTNDLDNRVLLAPVQYTPMNRKGRLPNTQHDQFVVKSLVNHYMIFDVVDMAADGQPTRLVGFYVWTSHLLAEMLHQKLHLIVMKMNRLNFTSDVNILSNIYRKEQRLYTNFLPAMDRLDMTVTYVKSIDVFTKFV